MNDLAKQEDKPIKPWLAAIEEAEKNFVEIAVKSGRDVKWKEEAYFAMQAVQQSEYLMKCHPNTIRNAVINVATIGLTLNKAFGLAYIVPRKGVACLDISYKGLLRLATDSGSIIWAKAVLVYKNDEFQMQGVDRIPFHKSDTFGDRGEIVGGYCVAKLHNGDYMVDTMTRDDLDHVRATSKTAAIWSEWQEEMMKKTLIKRASKTWPGTQLLDKAVTIINEHEGLEEKYLDGTANQINPEEVDAENIAFQADAIKGWIDDDVEDADKATELKEIWKSLSNDERLRIQGMLKDKAPDSGPRGKMYSTLLKEYLEQV